MSDENDEKERPTFEFTPGEPMMWKDGAESRPLVCRACRAPIIADLSVLVRIGAARFSDVEGEWEAFLEGLRRGEMTCVSCSMYDKIVAQGGGIGLPQRKPFVPESMHVPRDVAQAMCDHSGPIHEDIDATHDLAQFGKCLKCGARVVKARRSTRWKTRRSK